MVLWFSIGGASCFDGFLYHFIYSFFAGKGKGIEGLGFCFGIGNRLGCEELEPVGFQQHEIDMIGDDHAGSLIVGEIGVESKAQVGEEVDGSLQVFDGQVYEDLVGNGFGRRHESNLG